MSLRLVPAPATEVARMMRRASALAYYAGDPPDQPIAEAPLPRPQAAIGPAEGAAPEAAGIAASMDSGPVRTMQAALVGLIGSAFE